MKLDSFVRWRLHCFHFTYDAIFTISRRKFYIFLIYGRMTRREKLIEKHMNHVGWIMKFVCYAREEKIFRYFTNDDNEWRNKNMVDLKIVKLMFPILSKSSQVFMKINRCLTFPVSLWLNSIVSKIMKWIFFKIENLHNFISPILIETKQASIMRKDCII